MSWASSEVVGVLTFPRIGGSGKRDVRGDVYTENALFMWDAASKWSHAHNPPSRIHARSGITDDRCADVYGGLHLVCITHRVTRSDQGRLGSAVISIAPIRLAASVKCCTSSGES